MDPRVQPAGDGQGVLAMGFWVYILASRPGGTLYIGVTNNLVRRIFEHREGLVPGFTKRYGIKMLVYYERHDNQLSQPSLPGLTRQSIFFAKMRFRCYEEDGPAGQARG